MAHCYSVGVEIDGVEREVCVIVPGNEEFQREVEEAQRTGGKVREPSEDELNRAIEYHLQNHGHGTEKHKSNMDSFSEPEKESPDNYDDTMSGDMQRDRHKRRTVTVNDEDDEDGY